MAEEGGRCFCNGFLNVTLNTTDAYCESYCNGEILYKPAQIILQVLYVIVLLVGLLGNLLTCVIIIMRKSMRRSIHIYTFNLAVCDCLILMFYVPSQMIYIENQLNWVMGITVCKVNNIILPACLAATAFTILAITLDRARGLLQPFKWRSDSQRTAKISIPIIWLMSTLLCLPMFIYPTVSQEPFDGLELLLCYEVWPNVEIELIYWKSMFTLLFAVPLTVIFILHIIMVVVIAKDQNSINRKQNRKMIKMTIAVVTVYSICTGMQHTYFFLMTYGNFVSLNDNKFRALLFSTSNFVVSAQAALNPIIYGTFRQDFNKGFKSLGFKLMQVLKLQNSSLCNKSNNTEYQKYEDTTKPINDFDHYFETRKTSLATQLVSHITDSGFYSIVNETNQQNEVGYKTQNNNNMINQLKNDFLKIEQTPDSPLPPPRFCMLSKDVLQRLSYYMAESRDRKSVV